MRFRHAALNAARAILILDGANPETHEGVVAMLSLRLIRPGILPVEVVKNFKVLLSRRTDVDYGDFDSTGQTEADDSIRITADMIGLIESARKKLSKAVDLNACFPATVSRVAGFLLKILLTIRKYYQISPAPLFQRGESGIQRNTQGV